VKYAASSRRLELICPNPSLRPCLARLCCLSGLAGSILSLIGGPIRGGWINGSFVLFFAVATACFWSWDDGRCPAIRALTFLLTAPIHLRIIVYS